MRRFFTQSVDRKNLNFFKTYIIKSVYIPVMNNNTKFKIFRFFLSTLQYIGWIKPKNHLILLCLLTINVPVVYMVRYIVVMRGANP